MNKVKVLFLAANPEGTQPLNLGEEILQIIERAQRSKFRDLLEFIVKREVRPEDVAQVLLSECPHIFHFCGHANLVLQTGSRSDSVRDLGSKPTPAACELIFQDAQGNSESVGQGAIVHLIETIPDNLRVVVLNACHTRPLAEAIAQTIDCTIGMNRPIGDKAAIAFAAAFYEAIGFGRSVKVAFELGRNMMMRKDIPETQIPELLTRGGLDAAGLVLIPSKGSLGVALGGDGGNEGPLRIAIKGLRPFDEGDAGFFPGLLPNAHPDDGLPESVRYWIPRIEETAPKRTFPIGVIHGPSGCGKSSLVRAGLIPKLADHVLPVYVQATPSSTEATLLRELRSKCSQLPKTQKLNAALSALSRGEAIPSGKRKLLIVLDQFEQWLHANSGIEKTELLTALGHCDGGHLQTLVLVREDFWTATARFARQVRVELDTGSNNYMVDLFYQAHAEKVLTALGQAYGRVSSPVSPDQKEFIQDTVKALAVRGMVLPVRLAFFSVVFRSRDWGKPALEEIGGIKGIEIDLLESLFHSEYSQRMFGDHKEAAQSVLGALLPEDGSEIKTPRAVRQLLDVSGYTEQPERFEELLRILDQDLFLVTPTLREKTSTGGGGRASGPGDRFYQLTHDFLVPPLREWRDKGQEAAQLVEAVWMAETKNVPHLIEKLTRLRPWADPLLHRMVEDAGVDSKERLHASLALLPVDKDQVEFLYQRLLEAGPTELSVLREALGEHKEKLVERLWGVLDQAEPKGQELQAAGALALYDPANPRWQAAGGKVARAMAAVGSVDLRPWLDALRPARAHLTAPLADLYLDEHRTDTERSLVLDILLKEYAGDQPSLLGRLLVAAKRDGFDRLVSNLRAHKVTVVPLLEGELAKLPPEAGEAEKDYLARRQARAAIALVRFGEVHKVWPLLLHSPDPRLRSFIVNWLAPLGACPGEIATELDRLNALATHNSQLATPRMDAILFYPETSTRRALILALGKYDAASFSLAEGDSLAARLLHLYRTDVDAGVHGAAEWALRRWGQEGAVQEADAELQELEDRGGRRWFVNSQGQAFVVIEAPVEFQMGSPEGEEGRDTDETLHRRRISRRFAVATKAITRAQYETFARANPRQGVSGVERWCPDVAGPHLGASWYDAAAYCNWLSEQEGLEKCYEPNEKGEFAEGMKIVPDFLDKSGYRLPLEAEWEYSCRAGTVTSGYYGSSTELLQEHAWCIENAQDHAWPCGSLRPNDLGLFDTLGNVYEWCQERYQNYEPNEDGVISDHMNIRSYIVIDESPRLLRGGSFNGPAAVIRSANRSREAPAYRYIYFGFRPSRTYS